MKKSNLKKWIKFRHKVIRNIAYLVLYPFAKIKYNIKIIPFRENKNRQYLIVSNHQTPFDQFFIGMAFKMPIYYLATEDIFSNGWVSSLIRYLVAPIPIKKQTTDITAVKNCLRVAKEGGTIALAPEGNRTYSGKTEYMNPAIASLVKKLNLPLLIYRIEGGYGTEPRWSDVVRKGKMKGYVSRVVEPEEFKNLTNDELYELIKQELYVNEAVVDTNFYHKKSAEYLERAIYVCPFCGLSSFKSEGDNFTCLKCQKSVKYLPSKQFASEQSDFPFEFVADWYDYQNEYINNLDISKYISSPMYVDEADVSEVIIYKNKILMFKSATISLFGDKIKISNTVDGEIIFDFESTKAVTVLGKNKLNVYYGEKVYQFKGDKRFNALKYVNIFNHHKNIMSGDKNVKFLGL